MVTSLESQCLQSAFRGPMQEFLIFAFLFLKWMAKIKIYVDSSPDLQAHEILVIQRYIGYTHISIFTQMQEEN